jgi:tetratricopeptide (TPR) repeat protein
MTNARQVFSVLLGLFWAGCAAVIFQFVQLLGNAPFPFPALDAPYVNLIGTWNDLGVFLGLIVSLILVALGSLQLSKMTGVIVQVILAGALTMLAIINFSTAWIVVAVVAFAIFVASLTRGFVDASEKKSGTRGMYAGLVLIFALFFIFAGNGIAVSLQNYFQIQTLEVRPSMQGTLSVLESVYAKSPVFGTGPNTFAADWFLYRPTGIIATPFWDIGFNSGFASIATAAVTGGLVVLLAWLLLILSFSWTAFRALLAVPELGDRSYFLIVATAVGSLYLLVMHIVYVPEPVIGLLLFLFFGLFLASLRGSRFSREIHVSFKENPRIGFASILVVLILGVVALISVYGAGTVYASALRNQEANRYSAAGDFEKARAAILSAITLSPQDRYYRSLAALELARLNALVTSGASDAAAQTKFREILTAAIQAAAQTTAINPASYENWLTRASVYASVVPLKIDGSFDTAQAALLEAQKYNPQTPEVDFRIAQMKAALDDAAGARKSAEASLAKKADYTSAILLLAQVSLSEGKLTEAIASVESAAFLEPQNAQLAYQLGLLNLQAKKYDEAKESFIKALAVTPDYANASFFLGQAYFLLNQKDEALKEFKALLVKNADNQTLKDVIASIEKGDDPFAPVPASPADVKTPTK